MKKKIANSGIAVFLLLLFFNVSAFAQEAGDINILIDGKEIYESASKKITANIKVEFLNSVLITDKLALGYHIYDQEGEVLVTEGQRIYLTNIIDNQAETNLILELTTFPELKKQKYAEIVLDIVDEEMPQWYLSNENIEMKTAKIIYVDSFAKRLQKVFENIVNRPVLLLFQILLLSLCSIAYIKYKKSNKVEE